MTNKKILLTSFLFFSIFPLIPNKIKGLPVVLLFFVSIYLFVVSKNKKINFIKTLLFSSLYLMLLFGLIYTSNFDNIDIILTTRLSLLILPISFSLIASTNTNFEKKDMVLFYRLFFISCLIFCFIILMSLIKLGYFYSDVNINDVYFSLTNKMFSIHQHPIYSSIFISLAIFFGLIEIKSQKNKINLSIVIIGVLSLFLTLFFLSRKSAIIALCCSIIISTLLSPNNRFLKKIILSGTIFLFCLAIINPVVKKRFNELFIENTYKKITLYNSTSIRYGIFNCTLKLMKKKIIFGYGIGDVQDELQGCYSNKSDILELGKYNSHNQYFSFILSNGILGIVFMVLILYRSFLIGIKQHNFILLNFIIFFSIMFFFENLLERQTGVIIFMFFISFYNFITFSKNKINFEK